MIRIKKGLDLPILGAPKQVIESAKTVKTVALNGPDFIGMKPSMKVQVGDSVKIGQEIFSCKKNEGLIFTSPANGKVVEINRGERRVFETLVIEITGEDHVTFEHYKKSSPSSLSFGDVKALLVESGQWCALRTRPYSKVAPVAGDVKPHSLFITAMDTNPLCADPEIIIKEHSQDFSSGVEVLSKLTDGKTFVCKKAGSSISVPSASNIQVEEFGGKHPAGNPGTHIHFLDPVSSKKSVWFINYQDVIAVGKLFATGKLWTDRYISLAGPGVNNPRLLKTRLGANIDELVQGELKNGKQRVVSGSALFGRKVEGSFKYLGYFSRQVTVLSEGGEREFLGWQSPGFNKFSIKPTYISKLFPGKKFAFSTDTHGSVRAMVPIGMFEKVMPLDILPTHLLRALVCKDTDQAQALGCLELDEEDLALCTFAAPGKVDFGPILRENLTIIEKEG